MRPNFSLRTLLIIVGLAALAFWYSFAPSKTEVVYQWFRQQAADDAELIDCVWSIEAVFTANLAPVGEAVFGDLLFGTTNFDYEGHSFLHLANDGAGGCYMLWDRAGSSEPPSVVYVTSDGGYGVVASSFLDWPHILAHGVHISPYTDPPSISLWNPPGPNSKFDVQKRACLLRFRKAVVQRFGSMPELSELVAEREKLNAEFRAWVQRSTVPH